MVQPKTERFEMRLDEETIQRIDQWAGAQPDSPSRAEAMRRLIERGMDGHEKGSIHLTDGEKLIAFMLRDVYKHLGIKEGEINPDFIVDVVVGGHYWAPRWDMGGLFHSYADAPEDVRFVTDVLDMWDFIEVAFEKMSKGDKSAVKLGGKPFEPKFNGFDGNNEGELLGIARFLIEKMGRFQRFKKRGLNSHMPVREMYRRMLIEFNPIRSTLIHKGLSSKQLVDVLQAGRSQQQP